MRDLRHKRHRVSKCFFGAIILLFGAGCRAYMSSFQSSFFSKFSLRELVERNDSSAGLNCSAGGGGGGIGGGGGGISVGTGGVGAKESNFHRGESIACQITDSELFDETKFIEALKAIVEKDLAANKASIVKSKNADATSFSIEYTLNNVSGTVGISTTKGPMKFYTLNADLNEHSKDAE